MFNQLKLTASEPGLNHAGAAGCVEDRIKTIDAARFRGSWGTCFKLDRSSAPPTATQKLAAILETCAD